MFASSIASADCFIRSSTRLTLQDVNSLPVDVQKLVVPDARGQKCVLRYRVHVGNDWQTAEGIGYGATDTAACAQALDLKRGAVLEEVTPKTVRSDTQMVCSDLPEIRVRRVRIGETIFQSEVDMHTIPAERKDFMYKRSVCRMFVERDARNSNLMLDEGIICRVDDMPDSKWRVVDK